MASLSCLTIFEAGAFGSDSGTVVIPTIGTPFPITSMAVGSGTIAFDATADYELQYTGQGSITFASVGAGESSFIADGSGLIAFDATGVGSSAFSATGAGSITFAAAADDDTPPLSVLGAYLKKAADLTATDLSSSPVVAWTAETFDTDAVHDNVTANSKIIIPSSFNGKYAVIHAMVGLTQVGNGQTTTVAITKGGSVDYVGFGGRTKNPGNMSLLNPTWCSTQPMLLATAEEFEVIVHCTDTSTDIKAANSSFTIEIVG